MLKHVETWEQCGPVRVRRLRYAWQFSICELMVFTVSCVIAIPVAIDLFRSLPKWEDSAELTAEISDVVSNAVSLFAISIPAMLLLFVFVAAGMRNRMP